MVKPITIADIDKALDNVLEGQTKVGHIGGGFYLLPGGILCGEVMWNKFLNTRMEKIKADIEHWKEVNGYDCPFDYHGLQHIIKKI